MRHIIKNLRLGTVFLASMTLMVFGAAGYASLVEADDQCSPVKVSNQAIEATNMTDEG